MSPRDAIFEVLHLIKGFMWTLFTNSLSFWLLVALAPLIHAGSTRQTVEVELTTLHPGHPGSADVTLQWPAFDKLRLEVQEAGFRVDTSENIAPIVAYETQYSIAGSDDWITLSTAITGTSVPPDGRSRLDLHEKQLILTRADAGETINDGFFRLTMSHAGTSSLDMHQHTITPPIPFDATETQMKTALETLDVVSNVQVFRRALTTPGAYEWTVLFDPPPSSSSDHGNLPLLVMYSEAISAVYSGPGDQIAIQSLREGTRNPVMCVESCIFKVYELPVGQALSFRVRARFINGKWSAWQTSSSSLDIPATGASPWSPQVDFLTDYRVETTKPQSPPSNQPSSTHALLLSATGDAAANKNDQFYVHGTSSGGINQQDGEAGVVLLFPVLLTGERLAERSYFFSGQPQSYRVPLAEDPNRQVVALEVYAWGGGGGSGAKDSAIQHANGGGGAFARGLFRVSSRDRVDIAVGGGGRGSVNGGVVGGLGGGGDGGRGQFVGGGGGGASRVRINEKLVLVAAGGGGGGATDYCCAHGGAGGGGDGFAPDALSIPLDNTITGLARNEYHSINVEGDLRDFFGLPARHPHLDYGFAGPQADYSVLATAGGGASASAAGTAGKPSSFVVSRFGKCYIDEVSGALAIHGALPATEATRGRRDHGGKAQDGKEGGGGGGGGYYGGGGGGSGVDGTGGGGGSSFVAVTDLSQPTARAAIKSNERVKFAKAQAIRSTAVFLSWQAPQFGYSQQVEAFLVEMANRSVDEDFRVLRVIERSVWNVTIDGLSAFAWYRFRVRVLFRDGNAMYSEIQTLQTPATPTNVWKRLQGVRALDERGTHAGTRINDPAPARRYPSARRGHSLTTLDSFIYLFGGFSAGYACNLAHKAACVVEQGVNNELWRLDLLTKTWVQLTPMDTPPPARERHSMAVVANRVLLFGGRVSGMDDATAALQDLWELSISSTTAKTTATLRDRESSLAIPDGLEVFTMGNVPNTPDLCVVSLEIKVQLTHGCLQALKIELFGPGPSTFPQRQQSTVYPVDSQTQEMFWTDAGGFVGGGRRVTPPSPSARSFPVTLQSPKSSSSYAVCQSGSQSLVFSSTASFEALSVFHQLSASGGWTLSVADTVANDGLSGALDSWDINFSLAPCVPTVSWRDLTTVVTGTPPSRRFQHTAVVYQNAMFVYGGRNGRDLTDIYRLDYNAATGAGAWTTLVPVTTVAATTTSERRFHYGRTVVLTPYQLLSIGQGLRHRATRQQSHALGSGLFVARKSVTEPLHGWTRLDSLSVNDEDLSEPLGRYWSSAVFVYEPTRQPPNARIVVFGGQDDTTMFDDLWELRLQLLEEREPLDVLTQTRGEICDWRWANTALQATWTQSCAATTALVSASQATECSLETLLLYAWCDQTYQTLRL
ncbi:hypothetical protein Poli38472_009461 [Pythium oligandrum]|uniref:receptor protein-tyrosine kinase n=1 Tax=Pythium oligandrum TaxID=41045 RepID=A0A8K1CFA5_PYTOL|nr:hypothetical protein Poli38472_009461 [Pythium oligandrum]|eukprot:TMW61968.1 hypothetical protein Poli38472_009461 [Pythium oligandrum]